MQREVGKVSLEEAVDTLKRAGVPEDEMAALERQMASAPLKDGMRAMGFVSGGVETQNEAGEVLGRATRQAHANLEEIEIEGDGDDSEEEGAGVEVAQKSVPDAVFGDLVKARNSEEDETFERGVQRERSEDEPLGAKERFKRQKKQ